MGSVRILGIHGELRVIFFLRSEKQREKFFVSSQF